MPSGSGFDTQSEGDDLADRVERFRAAWQADQSTDLGPFLPARSAPHRPLVLVALIKEDMELRAKAALPIRAETYLGRYRRELRPAGIVSLIATEYRLRHKYGDKPRLAEYRSRFPDQFDALNASIGQAAVPDAPLIDRRADAPPAAPSERIIIPPSSAPGVLPDALPTPDATDALPADLNYRLIRVIGRGAFGQVYEAEAPGGFRVAVKQIIRSVDHPASQGEIEALEAIKALNHPFLLQTQAYWVFRNHLVIVMDLADESLSDRIAFHKSKGLPGVPPEELIPFFEQAAVALDYLHSQNVSHRDVKPQNLLLLKGYAKVADFGLARGHEHTMTKVGAEVGTPVYMAPEVWKQKVSLQSDQYSLAASYVQARLGRPLFKTYILHELAAAHMTERPDLSPLPAAEQRVLLKALAKKPDRRYPSCAEFTKALREAVLPPPKTRTRPPAWQVVSLVVAAALACGLMLGVVARVAPRPVAVVRQEPPARELWGRSGWDPDGDATETGLSGKEYYRRLTRTVAGEKLVAILVPQKRESDPATFYMLENKVTNRVFRELWDRVQKNPNSQLAQFRTLYGAETDRMLPGKWRDGVKPRPRGEPLGIDGEQAEVPVLGVTVPEAMLAADELGGLLPIVLQWKKAVGALGDDKREGVCGDVRWYTKPFRSLRVAVDLNKPWPVWDRWSSDPGGRGAATHTADLSVYGIHQLTSNGFEWTSEPDDDRERVSLLTPRTTTDPFIRVIGQSWDMPDVLTFKDILQMKKSTEWADTRDGSGFRIVLEPEAK
jgi:hypothetical protein